jgi:putative Holliday junction resolvase
MRPGVRLAIDWGKARIGVAASDPEGLIAFPVETVPAGPSALDRVAALVAEYEPIEVLLGLPRNLAGAEGPAALAMREVAAQLVVGLGATPLRLVDERMTTVTASKQLAKAGRNTRRQRQVIDQAAAVALLEAALHSERLTGLVAGELVQPNEGRTEADE